MILKLLTKFQVCDIILLPCDGKGGELGRVVSSQSSQTIGE